MHPAAPHTLDLGEMRFSQADQERFARLSLDVNPIHMDPVAARRVLPGQQLVHGVHSLLVMLERWTSGRLPVPSSLTCEFANPVCVGDTLSMAVAATDDNALVGRVGALTCVAVEFGALVAAPVWPPEGEWPDHSALTQPLQGTPEAWVGRRGQLRPPRDGYAKHFAAACSALGEDRVAAFGALSYLVGMVCPGLHSIFSSLHVSWGEGRELRFAVRRYDARFRQVQIEFDGALRGSLRAFVRPEPQAQPSLAELATRVEAGTFIGTTSLVIGGSRGIGEVTAKTIAAGGGTVVVTYAQGEADACRVEAEINAAAPGHCRVGRYVAGETAPAALGDAGAFDAVFYFATPRIFRKTGGHFDRALFDDFVGTYVVDFMRVGEWLEAGAAAREHPVRLFYPSSTAVAERPRGMTEYSMAKAAAELMIEDFNRAQRRVQVLVERLPRLPTDQTATLMQAKAGSTADVMLPVIRRMLAR